MSAAEASAEDTGTVIRGRAPALLAISHGTSDPAGQQVVRRLGNAVASAASARGLADTTVLGHVDVQQPDVQAALDSLGEGRPAVIVPLLLSAGYHVRVDLRRDVEAAEQAGRGVTVADALGPDDRLVELLVRRLGQAGADPAEDAVILGVAGSSDAGAQRDCREMAARLSARLGVEVPAAFLSFSEPTVAEAVERVRAETPGRRVVVASYLLAPGYFQGLMEQAEADVVTAPLLPAGSGRADGGSGEGSGGSRSGVPEELIEIILDRFTAGKDAIE